MPYPFVNLKENKAFILVKNKEKDDVIIFTENHEEIKHRIKLKIMEVNNEKHYHIWDRATGIFIKGKPWVRIRGRWVRTCLKCGYKEYWSQGMFTGWFSIP